MSERLRKFIEDLKGNSLINSFDEAKTKQGIVLPILQCLDWNIFNIDEVSPEHPAGGEVDFSLRINDVDKVFIEVKRFGWGLEQKEERQLCNYSSFKGIELAILTNGLSWQFYLPQLKCSWEQKIFWTINLKEQNLDDIVLRFSDFLEKRKIEGGEAIKNAEMFYEKQKREKKIKETLPKAWDSLISEPNELLIELVQNTTEKLCGYKPDNEEIKYFLKRSKVTGIINMPRADKSEEGKHEIENIAKIKGNDLRDFIFEIIYKSEKISREEAANKIYKKFEDIFKQDHYQSIDDSGLPRWQHKIDSIIAKRRKQGFIKSVDESGRGYWELTKKGKEDYKDKDHISI